MANHVIDLKQLKRALRGRAAPERNSSPPDAETLEDTGGSRREATPPPAGDERESSFALIAWEAPEFDHEAQGILGRLIVGGLLVLGGIFAVFFQNFLFAVFLLIAGGLMISYAYRPPLQVGFAVTSRGIVAGNRMYEFDGLESFWVRYEPPLFRELSLRSKRLVMPFIRIPLGGLDPVLIRNILLRFLPESEGEPSALDTFSRHLGF